MEERFKKKAVCQITKKEYPISELVRADSLRGPILELIKKKYPEWNGSGYISANLLNDFYMLHAQKIMKDEIGEISRLEEEVLKSIKDSGFFSKKIKPKYDEKLTFGQKVSDNVATFGGSWTFIILFVVFLIIWIIINSYFLIKKPFDPYPFILLNLFLSCIAALQAPIIMMSQRRQEARDRNRAENDYQINLKAEMEIRQLHEKTDHMVFHQFQLILEIQEIQINLLEEIAGKLQKKAEPLNLLPPIDKDDKAHTEPKSNEKSNRKPRNNTTPKKQKSQNKNQSK